jgi:PadR family transcriptional regulator PadR
VPLSEELYANFVTEMKRGTLALVILAKLHTPQYGYGLLQSLMDHGVEMEAGTLYPMLRRLEKQEILHCEWDTTEARPRKYYRLSETGKELYARLLNDYRRMVKQLDSLTGGEGNDSN